MTKAKKPKGSTRLSLFLEDDLIELLDKFRSRLPRATYAKQELAARLEDKKKK